ncbi:MAG: hypothetical protein JXR95_13570 [Deltaproteobacteria bacterium]|nr:hypothetical protein [Deltaproteobacteria bacterium]
MKTLEEYLEILNSLFSELGIFDLINLKIKDSSVIRVLVKEEKNIFYIRHEDMENFIEQFSSEELSDDKKAWDQFLKVFKNVSPNNYYEK